MRLGTCDGPRNLGVRWSVRLRILPWYQLGQVVVSRSSDHVLQFPCRKKEGRRGRHRVFSRWMVGRDGRWGGKALKIFQRVPVIWERASWRDSWDGGLLLPTTPYLRLSKGRSSGCFVLSWSNGQFHVQPRLLFGLLPGLLNSFPGLEEWWEGGPSISEGCWHRRCKDMFQPLDWFVLSVHPFEGDMRWRVWHCSGGVVLVLWQRRMRTVDLYRISESHGGRSVWIHGEENVWPLRPHLWFLNREWELPPSKGRGRPRPSMSHVCSKEGGQWQGQQIVVWKAEWRTREWGQVEDKWDDG